jgi:hypothetical protein
MRLEPARVEHIIVSHSAAVSARIRLDSANEKHASLVLSKEKIRKVTFYKFVYKHYGCVMNGLRSKLACLFVQASVLVKAITC